MVLLVKVCFMTFLYRSWTSSSCTPTSLVGFGWPQCNDWVSFYPRLYTLLHGVYRFLKYVWRRSLLRSIRLRKTIHRWWLPWKIIQESSERLSWMVWTWRYWRIAHLSSEYRIDVACLFTGEPFMKCCNDMFLPSYHK